MEWLIDFGGQNRLCLGVAGKVFTVDYLSLSVSLLLWFGLIRRGVLRRQSTQDCCWVTLVSFGRALHRLRGACPLWDREEEESVPWRNRIWADARDKAWGRRERG